MCTRIHDVEELLDISHGLQQSAVVSAIDGQCIFAPACVWAIVWWSGVVVSALASINEVNQRRPG